MRDWPILNFYKDVNPASRPRPKPWSHLCPLVPNVWSGWGNCCNWYNCRNNTNSVMQLISISLSYSLWGWVLMWRIQSIHIVVTAFGYTKWQLRSLLVLQSPFSVDTLCNSPAHYRNERYQVFVSFYSPIIWTHEIRNTLSDRGIMVPLFYNLCKMCYNENLSITASFSPCGQ